VSGFQLMVHDNDFVTYIWNHIYLKKRLSDSDPWEYETSRPVSGRRTSLVVNASSAAPHNFRLNLVFADTHAASEKRHPKEFDWWSYHSRRGWDDNDYTGAR
jgi:prepilin-type processing-associated H-X9-DG protein